MANADTTLNDIAQSVADLGQSIGDLGQSIADLGSMISVEMIQLRTDLGQQIKDVRGELVSFRLETNERLGRLENETLAIHSDLHEIYDHIY
jgi:uncharacterized protein YoxC